MVEELDLTVIIPTINEREALLRLDPELREAIARYRAEVLVVDDGSTDGTVELVRGWAPLGLYSLHERVGRTGLATAVVEGFALTRGRVIVVLDADGSHSAAALPSLAGPILEGSAEFVLGSRNVAGGSSPGLPAHRRAISWAAAALARPLTAVTDPMSGYFAVDRRVIGRSPLDPVGFKIALELLVRCRPSPVIEVPIHFGARRAGESKLGGIQIGGYARHLLRLYVWAWRHRGSRATRPEGVAGS